MDLSFIYANRTPKFFVGFMQALFKTYEKRRIYINDQVNLLIERVKNNDDCLFETTKWNEIYKSKKYTFDNSKYGKSIVQDNIKKFFDDYFDIVLKGEQNSEKRKFSKSCIVLAHHTTHSSDANLIEAKMTVIGTTSLIRIVNAIEDDNC